MPLTYRDEKGSRLTSDEVDENFRTLDAGKQNQLGFTPEDSADKGQANGYASLGSDGKVPAGQLPPATAITVDSVPIDGSSNPVASNGVYDALVLKQNSLGFTPENIANKKTDISSVSDNYYPTNKAINYIAQVGSHTATVISTLSKQSVDVNIVVFSDSTGVGPNLWPDLLSRYLATSFPAYTVIQYNANQSTWIYDAGTTIQTGTGSKTLRFYIGAVSGAQVTTGYAHIDTLLTVAPDLCIFSYGHNDNPSSSSVYRGFYFQFTNEVKRRYQSTGIILTAQNPKRSDVATYQQGLDNAVTIARLAATEGYGFFNVMQWFFDYGDYATDLLNVDGIHPNTTGQADWFNFIKQSFPLKNYSIPIFPKQQINELTFTSFVAVEGSPTFGINSVFAGNGGIAGWMMPDAVKSGIQSMAITLPTWWNTVEVNVLFQTPTSSAAKNIVFRFVQLPLDTSSATLATGTQGLSKVAQIVAGKAANTPNSCIIASYPGNTFTPTSPKYPFQFSVYRDADNASDTYDGQSVLITGVLFKRLT